MFSFDAELAALDKEGLRRRRRVLETPQRARVRVDGRDFVAFCSNDYLGLAAHPELIAAAREGAETYGVGAGASHLVLGHMRAHEALEDALASFVGLPRALFFSTGYLANLGVITALAGRGDAVFADRLNHASLNDAALLSRAEFRRYGHCDVHALERQLRGTSVRRRIIVTDAVFSMDGDLAPLPELIALAQRYDAAIVIDDAHGFGVLGARGRGVLEHLDLSSPRVVYMATLGKAAGVYGAFVAGEADLVESLVQRARTYIYTTATPPLLAHALLTSLELIERETWRRARLGELIALFKRRMRSTPWKLLPSDTAIQPVVIGGSAEAVAFSEALARCGLLVPAIRPPTVPRGTARLRVSLSADHEPEDVERLAEALAAHA